MKNKKIILVTCILLLKLLCINQPLYSQLSFNITITYSGRCYDIGYLPSSTFSVGGIPTRTDCQSMRNMMLSINNTLSQFGDSECKIRLICTSCTGSEITTTQANLNNVTINGTAVGKAFFSPSPGQTTQEWINSVQEKAQALELANTNTSNNGFILPSTGNKNYDEAYTSLVDNTFKKDAQGKAYMNGRMVDYDPSMFPTGKRLADPGYGIPSETPSYGNEDGNLDPYKDWYEDNVEWGKSVGLNFSAYLTKEDIDRWMSPNVSEIEANKYYEKYDEFRKEANRRVNGEKIDDGEESLFSEEFVNNTIDAMASVVTTIIPSYTPQGALGTLTIRAGAEGLKCYINGGKNCSRSRIIVNTIRNTATDIMFDVGGKVIASAAGDLLGWGEKALLGEATTSRTIVKNEKIVAKSITEVSARSEQKILFGAEKHFLLTGQTEKLLLENKSTEISLASKLIGRSRNAYNELIKAGYKVVDDGAEIIFKNTDNLSIAKINDNTLYIKIPEYPSDPTGWAIQANTSEAIEALNKATNGETLYKFGYFTKNIKTGMDEAKIVEAQFWSLEDPRKIGINEYFTKYGIPEESRVITLKAMEEGKGFVATATVKKDVPIITRPAVSVGKNKGGGMEIVVPISLDKNGNVIENGINIGSYFNYSEQLINPVLKPKK